jgi:hypothetical protein
MLVHSSSKSKRSYLDQTLMTWTILAHLLSHFAQTLNMSVQIQAIENPEGHLHWLQT